MIPDVQSHFETPKKIGPNPQKSYDFLITLVAIMFLSGGYAIWFISTYLYAYDDTEFAYTPKIHRASAAQVATSTDMTDWKTYRNEEYGFEIKYPQEIKIDTENDSIRFEKYTPREKEGLTPEEFFIVVWESSLLELKLNRFINLKEGILNGYKTHEADDLDGIISPYGPHLLFVRNKGDSGIVFAIYTSNSGFVSDSIKNVIDQILSTFKFIP